MSQLYTSVWREAIQHQIRELLFDPATGLIYDYVTAYEADKRFKHLPDNAEVATSFPNPCGWSTGMEDCAINTGLLLVDLVLNGESNSEFAQELALGVLRCGSLPGHRGFIVRGILPQDKRSFYLNSSRDQFTVASYAVWNLWRNISADSPLKSACQQFLCAVADYCERTVNAATNYDLLRADGGRAVVSKMWNSEIHEALRLPMIYGMAAHCSGQGRYFDLMQKFVNTGLNLTLSMQPESPQWWDMPLLQTQLSIAFFAQSGIVPAEEARWAQALNLISRAAQLRLPRQVEKAENFSGKWEVLYNNWRTLPMKLRAETLAADGHTARFDGLTYLVPQFDDSYSEPNILIRSIGNYLAIAALDPQTGIREEMLSRIARIAEQIDFRHFSGSGTVPFILGVDWSCFNLRQRGKEF